MVIGTSGLTEEDFAEIDQAALSNKVGVIAVGNSAITAVLLERFAREAAKHLSHWEIIDYTAVVTGRSVLKVRYQNQGSSSVFRYTRIYVKRQGRWQAIAQQLTHVPQPDSSDIRTSPE